MSNLRARTQAPHQRHCCNTLSAPLPLALLGTSDRQLRGAAARAPVADVDERAGVWQLGLHEEGADLLGRVHIALARDALHLLDLARARRRLNVLVVLLGVLRAAQQSNSRVS